MERPDIRTLPDEQLEQFFLMLDFGTQCRFRRTCRRWYRVLRSENVLHSICFPVRSTKPWLVKPTVLRGCIARAVPRVQTCLFVQDVADQPAIRHQPAWQGTHNRDFLWEILDCTIEHPVAERAFRHLILVGLTIKMSVLRMTSLPQSVELVTLIGVQITGYEVYFHSNDMAGYLYDMSHSGEPAVNVAGPCTIVPQSVSPNRPIKAMLNHSDASVTWKAILRDNVPAKLTVDERKAVYDYIDWIEQKREQRQVDLLDRLMVRLLRFQPELADRDYARLRQIRYTSFCEDVRRKLQEDVIALSLAHRTGQIGF